MAQLAAQQQTPQSQTRWSGARACVPHIPAMKTCPYGIRGWVGGKCYEARGQRQAGCRKHYRCAMAAKSADPVGVSHSWSNVSLQTGPAAHGIVIDRFNMTAIVSVVPSAPPDAARNAPSRAASEAGPSGLRRRGRTVVESCARAGVVSFVQANAGGQIDHTMPT